MSKREEEKEVQQNLSRLETLKYEQSNRVGPVGSHPMRTPLEAGLGLQPYTQRIALQRNVHLDSVSE